ncbi:MAG: hypothetical protein JW818_10395 [Pirellulales bacterium]|nr:hypothetical protein [Pirellulales bacterium]
MSWSAKLTSIDAVRELATALVVFGEAVTAALDNLAQDVRRGSEWIHHERPSYWNQEVRCSRERVGEARLELERALTFRRIAEQRPSCREEQAVLEAAKRRLRTAEEKQQVLKHWQHAVDHGMRELHGAQQPLAVWLQTQLPRALASLKQMAEALEAYAETGAAPPPSATLPNGTEEPAAPAGESDRDANLGPEHPGRENSPGREGPAGG